MDYAMVIANSRAKEEYPFTARSLRVNSNLENVEIHFSMNNKLVDYTNDYITVMVFVPCYSEQNGYYSSDVDIYYNDKKVLNVDCY